MAADTQSAAVKSARPNPRLGAGWLAQAAPAVAVVSAVFTMAVGGLLVWNHGRVPSADPLRSELLLAARERLHAAPKDEALKQEIRHLDQEVREQFFRHLDRNRWGAWLLAAGGVLLVVSAGKVARDRRAPPLPVPMVEEVEEQKRAGAWASRGAVAAVGAALVVALAWLARMESTPVPESEVALEKLLAGPSAAAVPETPPTREEILRNWPWFRGPRGDGVVFSTNLPVAWDGASGEGILWKTAVPAAGFNSPVVWGDRIFLSGGNESVREVLCFDTARGALLWRLPLPPPPGGLSPKPEIPEETGYAASTVATDGRRVYAIFGTGELAAVDVGGRLAWSKHLGVPDNIYGHASSLLVWEGKLIVQFDQADAEAGKSRLYAFAAATGQVVWEQKRDVGGSWATPVVVEAAGRPQLVTLSDPWLIAYDPGPGQELWRSKCLGADVAPSPILAGGLVIAVSPGKHTVALRPDGQGDVTQTHQAWRHKGLVPDITSPIATEELLFLLTTEGTIVCLEAKSGEEVWEQELEMEFNASPVLAGTRLYLVSTDGTTVMVAAERAFRELGRAALGEAVFATPAFLGDRIYLRGKTNLYAIGKAPPAVAVKTSAPHEGIEGPMRP